jgi:hypothetical protein
MFRREGSTYICGFKVTVVGDVEGAMKKLSLVWITWLSNFVARVLSSWEILHEFRKYR